MNGAYVPTIPDASTLGAASYYTWGRFVSNTLIADNELYGKMAYCPTGSASWQTRYVIPTELRFERLARSWARETENLSSIQEIVLHPAYQRIIGMGPDVVPFILRKLERIPGFWFWALRSLTGANPVTQEMRGDVAAMTEAWLNWGREHGYL
jgi:hypothetical protein